MQGLHISCQFAETKHLRLICIRRMKSRSSSTRKKERKKRLPSFLHMFSKFQHLEGLMKFGDNQKCQKLNQSIRCGRLRLQLCGECGEFWNLNGTLYTTQRVPTNFIALRSRLVFIVEQSLGRVPLLHNSSSALVMQITFPAKQIKGHFKKFICQPTFHRMQPLNTETINQS